MRLANRHKGCLFCGNRGGRFDAIEHIVSRSLGNDRRTGLVTEELVVPPGETCSKCNSGALSAQDNALTSWPPVSMMRSLALMPNRRGKLVHAAATTRWDLELDEADRRDFVLRVDADTSSRSGRDNVARALCKIAVETRLLEDPRDARSARWDPYARAAIGGPLPFDLAMGLELPTPDARHLDLRPSTSIIVSNEWPLRAVLDLSIVGLRLYLLIRTRPWRSQGTGWWLRDPFDGSMRGPRSIWLRGEGRARSVTPSLMPPTARGAVAGASIPLPTHHPGRSIVIEPGS